MNNDRWRWYSLPDNTQEHGDTLSYRSVLLWSVFWDRAFNWLAMVLITLIRRDWSKQFISPWPNLRPERLRFILVSYLCGNNWFGWYACSAVLEFTPVIQISIALSRNVVYSSSHVHRPNSTASHFSKGNMWIISYQSSFESGSARKFLSANE